MAARQGSQSNAWLSALITFVALFVIATVVAVVYYIKAEDYRTNAQMANDELGRIATNKEKNDLAKIVGKPEEGKTYMGTMQSIVDNLYSMVLGQAPAENKPATAKLNEISMQIKSVLESLGSDANPAFGPNGVALLNTISELKQKLEDTRADNTKAIEMAEQLQVALDDAQLKGKQERDALIAELDKFQAELNQIRDRFEGLQQTMTSSANEQIQSFKDKLEEEQLKLRQQQTALQDSEKKMAENQKLLQAALTQLDSLKPNPEQETAAYKPDAQIVRVDLRNGIVYLDAGINSHVYRGLTFAIYDINKPIPEDGKGKAEIEVFQVSERVSAARIVRGDKKDPIDPKDIVANLIWDGTTANKFVVAGNFDFDNDGKADPDGAQRIRELIERWGGKVTDAVGIDTDFVVIGEQPAAVARPTQEEVDADPLAQQRYEQAAQNSDRYAAILKQAGNLGVPVFNQKRFMYLIGYETLSNINVK